MYYYDIVYSMPKVNKCGFVFTNIIFARAAIRTVNLINNNINILYNMYMDVDESTSNKKALYEWCRKQA